MKKQIFSVLILLALTSPALAKIEYDSSQLLMMNSERVQGLVKSKVKKAENIQASQDDDPEADGIQVEPDALEALKDAMRIALSRPDQDGLRGDLFQTLRGELRDLNSHERVMQDLAAEAISALKAKPSLKTKTTYIQLLENMMQEIQGDVTDNTAYKKIVEEIRDANIKIRDEDKMKSLLKSMKIPESPSVRAAGILGKDSKKK